MVFASGAFLFIFLPITLAGNWLLRNKETKYKNAFLLVMSFFFYLNSGVFQFLLLLLSITVNYCVALSITCFKNKRNLAKSLLITGIIFNVGLLFIFKYLSFIWGQTSLLFGGFVPQKIAAITLPLGISFYTFQALSYVIDVYRNEELVDKSIVHVALYISFFPQLIAGPIVRWNDIRDRLIAENRGGDINVGLRRFTIGLAKKVIIANHMAVFADKAFSLLEEGNLTTSFAWLGAIAYTLQIYYDFSGYSDMAIGLGKIFGFNFLENFNYPYISRSITEFWRRWHISLSTWFRDYVYIPLGGNRCTKRRALLNLFVVWVLTGVWHGANYTFWLWGLIYYLLILIERIFKKGEQSKGIVISLFQRIYTMLAVSLLWVLFRSDSLTQAANYVYRMIVTTPYTSYQIGVTKLYYKNFIGYGLLAIIGCTPWVSRFKDFVSRRVGNKKYELMADGFVVLLFLLASAVTIDSNYNPFIYFNF